MKTTFRFLLVLGGGRRRPLSAMLMPVPAEDGSIELPTNFSISQNYSNLFNPSTNIEFRICIAQNI